MTAATQTAKQIDSEDAARVAARSKTRITKMTTYPIIANCNYESADDTTIHTIRQAIESGLTDDSDLIEAMDALESVLADHAEDGSEVGMKKCAEAEGCVLCAWTDEVREAVHAERLSRYRD